MFLMMGISNKLGLRAFHDLLGDTDTRESNNVIQ